MLQLICEGFNLTNIHNCTVITEPPVVYQQPKSNLPSVHEDLIITRDDASWILANSFLILTMQTGFAMLEAGSVSSKNVATIMMKNVADVAVGGLSYWVFGYALSFGEPSNAFCGYGDFFFTAKDDETMGQKYTHYVFHFSFATTSTTIVSGAVAERMKLSAYMVFSVLNTVVYCIPASWVWHYSGWLNQINFFDFAGGCVVHLTGGVSSLIATMILGPRLGRFGWAKNRYGMSSPVTALTGTFMMWWAWLAFNCGSSFGIQKNLWKTAAKVAVVTMNGSIGGSFMGLMISMLKNWGQKSIFHIPSIITSVLGGLVSVTASCAVVSPAEALLIGAIGGMVGILMTQLLEKFEIDDPVGTVPVHLFSALWGTLAVGLFGKKEFSYLNHAQGLFHGGGVTLLCTQILGATVIMGWSMFLTGVSFLVMKYTIGLRMDPEEEILGADWVEHGVRTENFAMKLEKILIDMKIKHEEIDSIAAKLVKALAVESHTDTVSGPPAESTVRHGIANVIDKALVMGKVLPSVSGPEGTIPGWVQHEEKADGDQKKPEGSKTMAKAMTKLKARRKGVF